MLKHNDIWAAIDALAAAHGFSPSGLARAASLDATTFNRSKRVSADGKQRWPSTESLAKILDITGASFLDFAALVHKTVLKTRINVLPLSALSSHSVGTKAGLFDESGKPAGKAWTKRAIPGTDDDDAFGLEVTTAAQAPGFRPGTLLVAAPGAKIQKGDRVAVVLANGTLQLREVAKLAGRKYELIGLSDGRGKGLAAAGKLSVERTGVRLIAKITQTVE